MKNLAKTQKNLVLFGGTLAISLLALSLLGVNKALAFSGSGAGSSGSPYLITTCSQITEINTALSSHYELANDISCAGQGTINTSMVTGTFTGVFDGNGHVLSGLNISGDDQLGLFKKLSTGSIVENFAIFGTISNTGSATGMVAATMDNDALITNVGTYGSIICNGSCGGVVGNMAGDTQVTLSYNTASVQSIGDGIVTGTGVGGLVGYASALTGHEIVIENSYSSGDVNSDGDSVGGLVGYGTNIVVTKTYAIGPVTGHDAVGGVAGYFDSSLMNNSFAANIVHTTIGYADPNHFGPIIGTAVGVNVSNNHYDSSQADAPATDDYGLGHSEAYYFIENTSNEPMDSWTFDADYWHTNFNTYPSLKPIFPPLMECAEPLSNKTWISASCNILPLGWGTPTWEARWSLHGKNQWHTITDMDDVRFGYARVDGLTSGTTYDLQLRYTNDYGTSAWGTNVITTTGTAPVSGGKGGGSVSTSKVSQTTGSTYSAPSSSQSTDKTNDLTELTPSNPLITPANAYAITPIINLANETNKVDTTNLFGRLFLGFGIAMVTMASISLIVKLFPSSG